MQVLLQFNGKKKNFVYRNPDLSVPELRWGRPGSVIECDSKDAELLTKGNDFKIVGSPDPITPEPILPQPIPVVVEEEKMVDEPVKRKAGRPAKVHDAFGDNGSDS